MELVEVEIIGQVITARYGTLSTGDILKTDQAFADHLVNDCKGAKWPEPKVEAAPLQVAIELPADPAAATVVETVVEQPPAVSAKPGYMTKPAAKASKSSGK